MGYLKLGKMTLKSLFSKPATIRYPYEHRPVYELTKGHVVCDIENCISCGACMRGCPTSAIKVNKQERTWAINPYDCITCRSCIRVCPKHCLSMNPMHTAPCTVKQVHLYHKHPLSQAEIEEEQRKAAEKAEKKRKAMEAAAAKKAAAKKDASEKPSPDEPTSDESASS
jgi:ech hydrogenase subunit F